MSFLGKGCESQTPPPVETDALEALHPEHKSYDQEVRDRLITAQTAHRSFIKEALEGGDEETELSATVARAMTAGILPRVVRGEAWRGSGVELLLLDGQIPGSALGVDVVRLANGGFFDSHITLLSQDPNSPDADAYTVASTGLLPQTNQGEAVDHEVLARIDAHLAVQ